METRQEYISDMVYFDEIEKTFLPKLKEYIEVYLKSNKENSCPKLIQHLENAKQDNKLLLDYIQCRKNNVNEAWNTLKMYVECRFIYYTNVFLDESNKIAEKIRYINEKRICGVLKNRDKFGRRIFFFDISKWNINEISVEDIGIAFIFGAEKFWREQDIKEKGVVVLENASGFSAAHVMQFNFRKMIRFRDIHKSFAISLSGIFCVNVGYGVSIATKMMLPLFPKKLKSRVFLYCSNQKPKELYDIASKEILPDWAGGKLSITEAAEDEFYFEKN